MTVITEQTASPSFIPEAVVNLYQAVNALTRVVRKTAENVEKITDVGFDVMELTLQAQRTQLLARQQQAITTTTIN
jgi:hypothetical protein